MPDMEQGMRERIAGFLPRALETAIGAYKFSAVQKDKDGAVMKKHQDACKVAVAHVELLYKLSEKIGKKTNSDTEQNDEDINKMIRKAQQEISLFDKK